MNILSRIIWHNQEKQINKEDLFYFIGGSDENETNLDSVEKYHFPTRIWSDCPSLNFPRSNPLVFELDDYIYAMSGYNNINDWYSSSKHFERYLKGSDHWEIIRLNPDLNRLFYRASTTPIIYEDKKGNEQILIFGGWRGTGFLNNFNMVDKEYFNK